MNRVTVRWMWAGWLVFGACSKPSPPDGMKEEARAPDENLPPAPSPLPKVSISSESIESYAPVIREVSQKKAVPDRIAVELSRAAVDEARDAGESRLVIEPPVEGELRFSGPSTLQFEPTEGFAPSQEYTVRLEALQTTEGVIEVEPPVERRFTTPPFELLRIDLRTVDRRRRRLQAEAVFSAPVDETTLASRLRFEAGGVPVKLQRVEAGSDRRSALITLPLASGEYTWRLEAGVSGTLGGTASRARGGLPVPDGPEVRIVDLSVEEGSDGYFVRIVCDDDAVSERTEFWDSELQTWLEVSMRCQLDAQDAQEAITFEPELDFELSPTRGGFRILGPFERGGYSMRIEAMTPSIDGGIVKAPFERSFTVPARTPQLRFTTQGRYLPPSAWSTLPFQHLNAPRVQFEVRHVRPENLVYWMSDSTESVSAREADLIHAETLNLPTRPDVMTTHGLDVRSRLGDPPQGLLELRLKADEAEATARIVVTDLNLVAKRGAQGVDVWTFQADTGAPRGAVVVQEVVQSGRVLHACTTDASGHCVLPAPPDDRTDPATPFALLARSGTDLTYLEYDEVQTPIPQAKGPSYTETTPYRAAIYGDRGVYRPGETARIAAVIRTSGYEAPPTEMPVVTELFDPRGKPVRRWVSRPNAAGMIQVDVPFGDYAETGVYRVVVKSSDSEIGSLRFNVEEFVPERMKVEVTAKNPSHDLSEPARFGVRAAYLFGGSAEGRRVELNCSGTPATYRPPGREGFSFGVWSDTEPSAMDLGRAEGTLNAEGKVELSCPVPEGSLGTLRIEGRAAVFEAGSGRSSQAGGTSWAFPEKYLIGLQTGSRKASPDRPVRVQGVVVDRQGKFANISEIELSLYRVEQEHGWSWDRSSGRYSYRRHQRLAKEGTQKVVVRGGEFTATLAPSSPGRGFVIRAEAGKAQTDLVLEGTQRYWWDDEESADETPRPERPLSLKLTAPPTIQVGRPQQVQAQMPFEGHLVWTVETDRVLRQEVVSAAEGPASWTFSVDGFVPNVYVTALAIANPRRTSPQAFLPTRAFGVRSLKVEPGRFVTDLNLDAPSEVRSNRSFEVKVRMPKASGRAFVTVAAVDEGILQLTEFESPDPAGVIFEPRGLGVKTYETVGWNLLLPGAGTARDTGGGAMGSAGGRPQPIEPVALWSGLVDMGDDGTATVTFDVPAYQGKLRVMAVAATASQMASQSASVVVKDPVVMQATFPRFLGSNDRLQIPVELQNLSGSRQSVKLTVRSDAPNRARVEGEPRTVELADGASRVEVFEVAAGPGGGPLRLEAEAVSQAGTFRQGSNLVLRPSRPVVRRRRTLELKVGRTALDEVLAGFVEGTAQVDVWVTPRRYGAALGHLTSLVRYPYGCVEQTTSSARPLLFVRNLVGASSDMSAKEVDDKVMAGIRRLMTMQTAVGGFGYWPGARVPDPWGTAYATHFLIDAKKAGYAVPRHVIDDAIAWLERYTAAAEDDRYSRWSRPYQHYVLALAGKGRPGQIRRLLAGTPDDGPARESRYLLQAALHLSGDRTYEPALREPDTSPVAFDARQPWNYYSDLRRRGLMLSTYVDVLGREGAEPLAASVAAALSRPGDPGYTTQEMAWGITGLGKMLDGARPGGFEASLIAAGRAVKADRSTGSEEGSDGRRWSLARTEGVAIDVSRAEGDLYAHVTVEGVPQDPGTSVFGDSGLAVRRSWVRPDGEPTGNRLKLGDLVYSRTTLINTTRDPIEYVALVDRFPAGWEVENPRLGRNSAMDFVDADDLWALEHMNVRDDRVEFFGRLDPGESREVVVGLRATTAGSFRIPPVAAEAMYDPELWARESGPQTTVVGPWQ